MQTSKYLHHSFLTGFIQSTNLGVEPLDFYADSCVTVMVPAGHSVMISISTLFLSRCCGCDYVQIFLSSACTGSNYTTVCSGTVFHPQVLDVELFSVRFHSDGRFQQMGFRLLYSFHPVSERPVQSETGQWECARPGASAVLQHVICSPGSLCAGDEDRVVDACPSELCGPSVVSLIGSCYRFGGRSRYKFSCDQAELGCKQDKSHLISLNTQREWRSYFSWVGDGEELFSHNIPAGLKLTARLSLGV